MNQMAPQASGAAAGGVAAPMVSVVVPTPLGSAMASSAASTVRHESIVLSLSLQDENSNMPC
jgi:hypothetical protein